MPPLVVYLTPTSTEIAPLVTAHGAAEKWECINDWPPNGDEDYVTTASEGSGVWSLSSAATLDPDHPIQHVALHSTVKGTATAVTGVAAFLLFLPGGGEYSGAARSLEVGAGYRTYRDVWPTNPDTGLPWQIADFASLFVGHTMTYTDPVPPRLTSLVLEVSQALPRIAGAGANAGIVAAAAPQAKLAAAGVPGPGSLRASGLSLGVQTSATRLGPAGEGG